MQASDCKLAHTVGNGIPVFIPVNFEAQASAVVPVLARLARAREDELSIIIELPTTTSIPQTPHLVTQFSARGV